MPLGEKSVRRERAKRSNAPYRANVIRLSRFARSSYRGAVRHTLPATPATDVFMATRCMTGLLGDDVPPALRAFAEGCTVHAPARRPGDAWRLLAELDDLLERLYGPRTFRPFAMPA